MGKPFSGVEIAESASLRHRQVTFWSPPVLDCPCHARTRGNKWRKERVMALISLAPSLPDFQIN